MNYVEQRSWRPIKSPKKRRKMGRLRGEGDLNGNSDLIGKGVVLLVIERLYDALLVTVREREAERGRCS